MKVSIQDNEGNSIKDFYTSWSAVECFEFARIWVHKYNRMINKKQLKGPLALKAKVNDTQFFFNDSDS